MTTHELQTVVMFEGIALLLIILVVVSAMRRWKVPLILASVAATATLLTIWSLVMAVGSILVYAPASTLMWFEVDKKTDLAQDSSKRFIRSICWLLLALGVSMLILKNIYNIYSYLN